MNKAFLITITLAFSLIPLYTYSAEKSSAHEVQAKLYQLSPAILRDFSAVTISSESFVLVIEAEAFVTDEPVWDAAGRQRGTRRVAIPKRHGFIIRVEHREHSNSVRRTAEDDRGDYIQYSTKIILSQEKAEESTDVRAEAVFLDYQRGKELPESWRSRISALIEELVSFDVKNKK
ncbi:MAG: hypothetical protein ACREJJ_08420 [Candidatus Methylomirabilales bacterium]